MYVPKYYVLCYSLSVTEFTAPSTDYPFQALDLTYIYALLHDGYHIADDTKVHVSIGEMADANVVNRSASSVPTGHCILI